MRTEFRVLLRTGKLHQLEAAELALKQAALPHNLQEESVSGMVTAMPIDPSPAPGTWWTILVPTEYFDKAGEVIAQLPFSYTTEPDVWDCAPSPRGKRLISIAIWVAIMAIVATAIAVLMRG